MTSIPEALACTIARMEIERSGHISALNDLNARNGELEQQLAAEAVRNADLETRAQNLSARTAQLEAQLAELTAAPV